MAKKLPTLARNTLPILSSNATAESLDAYIRFANNVPMLTQEEEHEYATALREQNDLQAAQNLILAHLRFVIKIAKSFAGYGLALADLIQEGNIGLMKAVRRFDPTVGVRLVTFAVHWIKAEIHDFVIRNWRIVKVATTKAQRKLFFNLRSSKKRLGWFSKDEIKDVANELNVKPAEVIEMERRMNAHDMTYDIPDEADNDETCFAPAQYLTSHYDEPEQSTLDSESSDNATAQLSQALATLDARSKDIIASRWLAEKKTTLHDLAAKYQISAERVRQLEAHAMKQLKAYMADAA